ncbi:unnamed protein product [Ectocarpus sp. 8 AP-2014]
MIEFSLCSVRVSLYRRAVSAPRKAGRLFFPVVEREGGFLSLLLQSTPAWQLYLYLFYFFVGVERWSGFLKCPKARLYFSPEFRGSSHRAKTCFTWLGSASSSPWTCMCTAVYLHRDSTGQPARCRCLPPRLSHARRSSREE